MARTGVEYSQAQIDRSGVIPIDNPRRVGAYQQPNLPYRFNDFEDLTGRYFVGDVVTEDTKWNNYLGNVTDMTPEDYYNALGDAQTTRNKFGRAIVNMLATAATTAVTNIAGLPVGIFQAMESGDFSKVWDNAVTQASEETLNWLNEANPIYRGSNYENLTAWQRLGTDTFWADALQSIGFTLGMVGPAMGTSAIMQAAGVGAKASSWISSLLNAYGESAIEASSQKSEYDREVENTRNSIEDNYNLSNYLADLRFRQDSIALEASKDTNPSLYAVNKSLLNSNYKEYKETLNSTREQLLDDLEKNRKDTITAGNLVFGADMALLTLSGAFEFGDFFAHGYNGAKKAANALTKEYRDTFIGGMKNLAKTASKEELEKFVAPTVGELYLKKLGKVAATGISEGLEEGTQNVIQNWGDIYSKNNNYFFDATYDQDAITKTNGLLDSFVSALAQAANDENAKSEAISGFLTGLLFGGAISNPMTPYRQAKQSQEIANKINTWLEDRPNTLTYYKNLIRQIALSGVEHGYLEKEDVKGVKDAQSAKFVNNMLTFYKAGRLDILKGMLSDSLESYTDDEINKIIDDTSVDGNGPFMINGNRLSVEETRQQLTETLNNLNGRIQEFEDDLDTYSTKYPDASDDTLEQMIFLKQQIRDSSDRREKLGDELFSFYQNKLAELKEDLDARRKKAGSNNRAIADSKRIAFDKEQKVLDDLSEISTKRMFLKALSNKEILEGFKEMLDDPNMDIDADEKKDIIKKYNDTIRLTESIKEYIKGLADLTSDISKANKKHEDAKAEAVEKVNNANKDDIKEQLKRAQNLSEFKSALNTIENSDDKTKAIDELAEEGDENAKAYKDFNIYSASIRDAVNKLKEDDETRADALSLFGSQFANSNTLEELADRESIYINDATFFETPDVTVENAQNRFYKAQYALQRAMHAVNNSNKFKDRFSAQYKVPPKKAPDMPASKGVNTDTTGSDAVTTTPSVTPTTKPVVLPPNAPISATPQDIINENNDLNDSSEDSEQYTKRVGGGEQRTYYRPVIPELHIEASKGKGTQGGLRDFRPFKEVIKEREKGLDFDAIYDYLHDKGAFDYVNKGNLKVEDKIYFMIDPSFNDHTVFMVTESGQVVGSLDEGNSIQKFKGLKELLERVRKGFENQEDKTKPFTSTEYTQVSQIFEGKIPTTKYEDGKPVNENRSLSDIPGAQAKDTPKFGIVKNGRLDTNGAFEYGEVENPKNISDKEGRLYLIIPNAKGKYSVAGVRIKHFNKEEFDITQPTISDTTVGKSLLSAIKKLANVENDAERGEAAKALGSVLYDGDLHINLLDSAGKEISEKNNNLGARPSAIKLSKILRDKNGRALTEVVNGETRVKDEVKTISLNEKGWDSSTEFVIRGEGDIKTAPDRRSEDVLVEEIINALMEFNLPLQVDSSKLNQQGYNASLINSGVLVSNIRRAEKIGAWFTVNALDENGNQLTAPKVEAPKPVTPASLPNTNTIDGIETVEPVVTTPPSQSHSDRLDAIEKAIVKEGITEETVDQKLLEASKIPGEAWQMDYIVINTPNGDVVRKVPTIFLGKTEDNKEVRLYGESSFTEGMGNAEGWFVYRWYAVFPNGNTVLVMPTQAGLDRVSVSAVKNKVGAALKGNIQRLNAELAKTTVVSSLLEANEEAKPSTIDTSKPDKTSTTNKAAKALTKMSKAMGDFEDFENDESEDIGKLRKVDTYKRPIWKPEVEMKWLQKALPQLLNQERVRIVEGLDRVAERGTIAWGKYKDGIITLANTSAEGTLYHEAFHYVVDVMMNNDEKKALFNEVKLKYGKLSEAELEERLAEAFREYVMTQESQSLGQKILNFFKNLYTKIKYWNSVSPYIDNVFKNIYNGKYAQETDIFETVESSKKTTVLWANISSDVKQDLIAQGWTEKDFNSLPESTKEHALKCVGV